MPLCIRRNAAAADPAMSISVANRICALLANADNNNVQPLRSDGRVKGTDGARSRFVFAQARPQRQGIMDAKYDVQHYLYALEPTNAGPAARIKRGAPSRRLYWVLQCV